MGTHTAQNRFLQGMAGLRRATGLNCYEMESIQEQNLAPNFTRVSGQLLSVRRTTRASRVLDLI